MNYGETLSDLPAAIASASNKYIENVMYINNKKPVESKCYTEKLGVNQCVISAKNAVMNKLGVKIDDTIIEQVIRFGNADISEKYLKESD